MPTSTLIRNAAWTAEWDAAACRHFYGQGRDVLLAEGRTVDAIPCLDQSETLSVNTPEQLAAVAAALASRPT